MDFNDEVMRWTKMSIFEQSQSNNWSIWDGDLIWGG